MSGSLSDVCSKYHQKLTLLIILNKKVILSSESTPKTFLTADKQIK
jgi:hypothetical protein